MTIRCESEREEDVHEPGLYGGVAYGTVPLIETGCDYACPCFRVFLSNQNDSDVLGYWAKLLRWKRRQYVRNVGPLSYPRFSKRPSKES